MAVRDESPVMRTAVGPPPPVNLSVWEDDVPPQSELQAPHDLQPVYSVLMHAPDDAPTQGTTERADWLIQWFVEGNRHQIQTQLGRAYRSGLGVRSSRDFTWPDRGWNSEDHFRIHAGVAIRDNPTAVVARNQSYLEAIFLLVRLRKLGIECSLTSSSPAVIEKYELTQHPDEASAEAAWRMYQQGSRRGGGGGAQAMHDELVRMAQELGLPHPGEMIRGLASGDQQPAHRFAAAAAAALAMSGRSTDVVDTFFEAMRRHMEGHNKSSGTKKNILDSLPKIIMAEDTKTTKGEPIPACTICVDEFVTGDELTYLPCGHYFHLGSQVPCMQSMYHIVDIVILSFFLPIVVM